MAGLPYEPWTQLLRQSYASSCPVHRPVPCIRPQLQRHLTKHAYTACRPQHRKSGACSSSTESISFQEGLQGRQLVRSLRQEIHSAGRQPISLECRSLIYRLTGLCSAGQKAEVRDALVQVSSATPAVATNLSHLGLCPTLLASA